MVKILSDLDEEDFFGLITFDSEILYWKEELVQATSANVETAQGFARSIQDRGGRVLRKLHLDFLFFFFFAGGCLYNIFFYYY